MAQSFIAIGSNLGDREKNLASALEFLSKLVEIEQSSSWVETEAQKVQTPQRDYLNGVIKVQTDLSPSGLLKALESVEAMMGRDMYEKGQYQSRSIDLDILTYDDWVVSTDELTLPHPRISERDFVLIPLLEIEPDWKHPVSGLTASQMLKDLSGPLPKLEDQ